MGSPVYTTSQLTSSSEHPTIQYSDNMFIEDEADAVFNEIRNLKKDNDDREEEITTNSERTPAATETKAVSPGRARAPLITMNVDVVSREEQSSDIELEEPVSPPPVSPVRVHLSSSLRVS